MDVILEVLVGDVGGFAEERSVEGDDREDGENQADGGESGFAANEFRGDVVDVVDGNGRDEAAGGSRFAQRPDRGGDGKKVGTAEDDVEEDVRVEEKTRFHGA